MTDLRCDVLIIGSGAAGGVLAATLAEGGADVVILEKGGYFGHEFFNQRELDMRVLYARRQERSTADGAIPVRGGECVGGGTTVNLALCFDPAEPVWSGWRRDHGLRGFSFDAAAADYDVTGLNLARATADVRRRINVHTPPEDAVNDNNRAFERGCQALGIATRRFELNMRDCLRCGFCAEGCAYDRKQGTMITFLADALSHGARLVHHCTVDRIDVARSRGQLRAVGASGVIRPTRLGSRPNTLPPGRVRVRAKVLITSAGSIESPALLQRSRHPDPHSLVGRGLILHPSLPVVGLMDRELVNYRGITGTVYSDHFAASHGFYIECLFGHPMYGATVLPGFGLTHFDTMRCYTRAIGFGVMLVDSVDPGNRVEWNAAVGRPVIHYRLTEPDKARLRTGAVQGVRIMFAAGAREVLLASEEPIGPLRQPRFTQAEEARYCEQLHFLPHATTITSAHCQATVKMGEDPRSAVVNSRCESLQVQNLLVCDSSVFPTSCGVNPMVSVMALARYQGLRIAAEAARYGL